MDLSSKHLGTTTRWQELGQLLERQNFTCVYTGRQLILGLNTSIDHIKPLTKWEETSLPCEVNALSNLQPLWKEDNIKKYNNYKEPI